MPDNLTIAEKVAKTLETGNVHTFTLPASDFADNRPPGLEQFLRDLKRPWLKVEIQSSLDALRDAGLVPEQVVERCQVHEGDTGEPGRMLLFKLGREG